MAFTNKRIEFQILGFCVIFFVLLPLFYKETFPSTKEGNNAAYPIKILLNEALQSEFGLPVTIKGRSALFYCIKDGETITDTIAHLILSKMGRNIDFVYNDTSVLIEGKFIVPNFQEIKYGRAYDPETYKVTTLSIYKVYNVIRTGNWNIKEKGNIKSLNFDLIIDSTRMNMNCN